MRQSEEQIKTVRCQSPKHLSVSFQPRNVQYLGSLAYTIWLFTFTDLKTIVIPSTIFGISNAFAASSFGIEDPKWISKNSSEGFLRCAYVACWVWINLLPFAINNQRQSEAIAEDSINKPWRPLPSKRLSQDEAQHIMLVFYVIAIGVSYSLGGFKQCLAGVLLGAWYNSFRGSDSDFVIRNLLNALGFLGFTSGALEVALSQPLPLNSRLVSWFGLLAFVVFTTVHTQDIEDQAGDRARTRRTVPIVIGDGPARWSVAVAMVFWAYACPKFWSITLPASTLFMIYSVIIASRYLVLRRLKDDKVSFRMWNAWMVCVYVLPFLKRYL